MLTRVRALPLRPSWQPAPRRLVWLADLLVLDERFDEAVAHYLLAYRQETGPKWFLRAAAVQIHQGQLDEAERTLDRAAAAGAQRTTLDEFYLQIDLRRQGGAG